MQRKCLLIAAFIYGLLPVYAQLCSGSLGDPVVKIDFGSGTATHGAALGSSVTSYTYTNADFPNDGSYTIESRTNTAGTWWTTTDHTGGGYMMVVNASTSITDYFYKKTVTGLCPDTTYEFAAWIMNLLRNQDNSTPNITFTIEKEDGTILESYNTGNIPLAGSALWKQFGFFFDTPAGIDTVVIRMRNNKAGAAPGNDIALDDITFRACGPTVTSAVANNSGTSIQVCEGQEGSYVLNGAITTSGVYTTPAYQWQLSTNSGTTWTDIPGANSTTYTAQPVGAGIYIYRLSTAETANIGSAACRVASNVITVTVNDAPNAPVVAISPTQCGTPTGSITITSPVGYTYSIDGTNYVSTTTFSSLAEASYNVTAKDNITGCVSADTVVYVSVGSGVPNAPAVTAAPPATCASANGSLTVADTAAGYSFDNGVTWGTTNTVSLPPGNYLVKVQNAQGCASGATAVTIPAATGFPPVPTVIIIQPDCITSTATITITDSQAQYSFNNGATWVTANTLSGVAAGTYQVLTKNAFGCLSDPATVVINAYINNEPLPVANAAQSFCIYNNPAISDLAVTGSNVKWYATTTGGSALAGTTALQDGITYYATQTVNICESNRVAVTAAVLNSAAPTGNGGQQFCTTQNPTIALLEATGTTIQWYATATGGSPLASNISLLNGTTYYATQTANGCESQVRFAVTVTIIGPSILVNNASDFICDALNDGKETVDLTAYTSQLTADAGSTFTYYTSVTAANTKVATQEITAPESYGLLSGSSTIYVRIESSDKCYQVVTLTLTLVNVPVVAINDTVILCENSVVVVNAGSGFDSYSWSNGQTAEAIVITAAGSYSVTVTQNHGGTVCTTVKDFTVVLSNRATISSIEIGDWTEDENTIEVFVSGVGNYEYSLDNATWQDVSVFTGLEPGHYFVYVRDKNECGTVSDDIYLLNYPKYFTPNGDGQNDAWHVEFATYEPGIITEIFDRYGKLLKTLRYRESWDGTFNGVNLPSTDYWFVVKRASGKVYKGHFSMIR